jgi:N-acetylneuraminate synthase
VTAPATYVIAEAGVNHDGSLERALALVDVAADAGADAVKFQTFRAESIAAAGARKARYQAETTGTAESQLEMLRRLELAPEHHDALSARCRERGIEFLSTAFDRESLDLLVGRLGIARVKVPSGEITNGPLLLAMARTGLPIILSTGMSTLDEIREALGVLAHGWTVEHDPLTSADFRALVRAPGAAELVRERVTILQCTTEYPAPFADVNLRAMDTLRDTFGAAVGLSDHSPGIAVPIAAVSRGATVVEKHFTLDRTLPGPDHRASLEPDELSAMIEGIRAVEQALGDGEKSPRPSELGNRDVARRSLVAARAIAAGAIITADDVTAKRPGTGRSPMDTWNVIGTRATRDLVPDEPIPDDEERV